MSQCHVKIPFRFAVRPENLRQRYTLRTRNHFLRYCNRPFASVSEMDEHLIERWNAAVGDNDIVFHLGDFALDDADYVRSIFDRLKGRKYLSWAITMFAGARTSNRTFLRSIGSSFRLRPLKRGMRAEGSF